MEFVFCAFDPARVILSIAEDLAGNAVKQAFNISESSAALPCSSA
jgi:hypothetical protein